uniref:Uncharacterized protein n=1 Tax=Cacopsylla melanoneura TaxID=428564 RepID=A0A8D9E998_9HEMI
MFGRKICDAHQLVCNLGIGKDFLPHIIKELSFDVFDIVAQRYKMFGVTRLLLNTTNHGLKLFVNLFQIIQISACNFLDNFIHVFACLVLQIFLFTLLVQPSKVKLFIA